MFPLHNTRDLSYCSQDIKFLARPVVELLSVGIISHSYFSFRITRGVRSLLSEKSSFVITQAACSSNAVSTLSIMPTIPRLFSSVNLVLSEDQAVLVCVRNKLQIMPVTGFDAVVSLSVALSA